MRLQTPRSARYGASRALRHEAAAPRPPRVLRAALLAATLLAGSLLPVAMPTPAQARSAPDSFADLAASLLPAVVNISSTQDVPASAAGPSAPDMPAFPPGSPFEQFFKDFMNRTHPGGPGGRQQGQAGPQGDGGGMRRMQSVGSGFIVDSSGIVVTNNHVIDNGTEVTVTLQDNTTLKAKVLGHDERTDLAVLKVEAGHPLPALAFGDSDVPRVGDWVLAIGNPYALGGTVTAGIISARGRDIHQGPYDDFLQTDAPINRGNSGGPLFDMDGKVIGVNTAIYSPSGGSIGLGFSIPSNMVKLVVAQLQQYGHARRGWLGVRIQQVTPDIAESLGLHGTDGVMVAGVNDGGPAALAHLHGGDVILKFNNQDVKELKTLPRIVAETAIDQTVPVDVWRDGRDQVLQVKVAEMPDDMTVADAGTPAPPKPPASTGAELSDLGMKIAPITDASRQKFQLGADQKGVVVTDVSKGGAAADRGVKPGDVIVEVQQEAVASTADVQGRVDAIRKQNRKAVLMLIQGSDGLRWVPLPLNGGKVQPG